MLVPARTVPVPAAFELTRHVTVVAGLLVPVTDALNCMVAPPDDIALLLIVWLAGLTLTLVTAGAVTVVPPP